MMPIKTLHLTNAYHPSSGGIRTFYHAMFAAAEEMGREMRLIVPGEHTRSQDVGTCGRIYYVESRHSPIGDARYRMLSPFNPLVRQIVREERANLIEIADKYTLPPLTRWIRKDARRSARTAATTSAAPVAPAPVLVAINHERLDDNLRAYMPRLPSRATDALARQYLRRFYLPAFDCHIANSDYTAAELHAAAARMRRPPRIQTLHMGVDADSMSPDRRAPEKRDRLLASLNLPDSAVLLLYVGRLAAEKNLMLLVEMLAHLPERFIVLLAGSGTAEPSLRAAAGARAPGRLHFLGQMNDREALAELYANVDAFVHPNPREPFGIAPLEAMASGIPLIAPDRGGVTSYANAANAWLAEPTGQAFASAVLRATGLAPHGAEPPADRNQKLSAARQTASEHRWPIVARQYFELFDQLVREARRGSLAVC
jgi:alpha-1,6-mannosyltransferase